MKEDVCYESSLCLHIFNSPESNRSMIDVDLKETGNVSVFYFLTKTERAKTETKAVFVQQCGSKLPSPL